MHEEPGPLRTPDDRRAEERADDDDLLVGAAEVGERIVGPGPGAPPSGAVPGSRGIGFRRPAVERPSVPPRPFEAVAMRVGPHRVAIPSERIVAVLPYRPPDAVPLSRPFIEGVFDHEGDVIAVVDLRARLGLPPTGADQLTRLVVVSGTAENAALRVDAMGEDGIVEGAGFDRAPGIAIGPEASFIRGVVRLPGGLAFLVDVDDLVDVE
jgi:purine-binding chemotaxis protein CheW